MKEKDPRNVNYTMIVALKCVVQKKKQSDFMECSRDSLTEQSICVINLKEVGSLSLSSLIKMYMHGNSVHTYSGEDLKYKSRIGCDSNGTQIMVAIVVLNLHIKVLGCWISPGTLAFFSIPTQLPLF